MKYGRDELTQAVRLNDAMGDTQGVEGMTKAFEISIDDLTYVSGERSKMSLGLMLMARDLPGQASLFALQSVWLDGFFAALHMLEQESS